MKKIKFLLLHLGYGGIETATINSANALSELYDVEIVSLYNLESNQTFKLSDKVKIKYLYDGGPNKKEFMEAIKAKKIFKMFGEVIKALYILYLKKVLIIDEIKRNDYDVIVSTRMEFSKLLSKYGNNNKIKIAQEHRYHNHEKRYLNTIKNKYNNIDYLFALTQTLERDYKELLQKNEHTQVVLVPNMIIYLPEEKTNLENTNLISVGRLHSGKRIDEIINIYSKTNTNKGCLYIIGDGEEHDKIQDLIEKNRLKSCVKMLGYKNEKEIFEFYKKSSLFLMASISEGLPMVLIEAMSCGLPCIAYETENGVSDIIKDNYNGYIIKNRNESEFINKIEETLKDRKKLKKLSNNAVITAKKYYKDEIVSIWKKIIG